MKNKFKPGDVVRSNHAPDRKGTVIRDVTDQIIMSNYCGRYYLVEFVEDYGSGISQEYKSLFQEKALFQDFRDLIQIAIDRSPAGEVE